mmetsp:Transcript_15398/g.26436  ORF Transcript_15398/g.26436 Transcript_15398/m.26436 type:complete len:205 (-) Transcript_15398:205-819(-)
MGPLPPALVLAGAVSMLPHRPTSYAISTPCSPPKDGADHHPLGLVRRPDLFRVFPVLHRHHQHQDARGARVTCHPYQRLERYLVLLPRSLHGLGQATLPRNRGMPLATPVPPLPLPLHVNTCRIHHLCPFQHGSDLEPRPLERLPTLVRLLLLRVHPRLHWAGQGLAGKNPGLHRRQVFPAVRAAPGGDHWDHVRLRIRGEGVV